MVVKKKPETQFHIAQEESNTKLEQLNNEKLRHELGTANHNLTVRTQQVEELERALKIFDRVSKFNPNPGWLVKEPSSASKKHHGTWTVMLSDLHLDEVVNFDEVMGMNKLNREISSMRLAKIFNGIVKIADDWHSGITVDGLVMQWGGDLFAGVIHDELRRTNEAPILDTLDYWVDHMVQGVEMMAEHFGKVYIPVVVGNHGRYDRKPLAKLRARENYEWYFAKTVARVIAERKIKNVDFHISDSADLVYMTYGYRKMLTHGDQARGGSGWGGVMSPIMRLDDKKQKRQSAVGLPYDYIDIGHWHQLTWMPRGMINGCMSGYDEYAFLNNFGFEEPQQGMYLMTPEHGRTFTAPIFCQDPILEGWGLEKPNSIK
jgi:hypothetical protein